MTTQASPDFNAELTRQTKATESAQALASVDRERQTVYALAHANVALLSRLNAAESRLAETYEHWREARGAELALVRNDLEEARRANRRLLEDQYSLLGRLHAVEAECAAALAERDELTTRYERLDRQNDDLVAEHEMMRHQASEARISAQAANNAMYHAIKRERDAETRIADLLAERSALCDVLSADSTTVAGQTLVEGLRAIIAERDAAQTKLGIAGRMARYLGWAFEQKLIIKSEAAELLDQVLREWKDASS